MASKRGRTVNGSQKKIDEKKIDESLITYEDAKDYFNYKETSIIDSKLVNQEQLSSHVIDFCQTYTCLWLRVSD